MSMTNQYDVKMDFPNGTTIKSHRSMSVGQSGITQVEEEVEVEGSISEIYASGPAWMFESISIREGSFSFISDGETVRPRTKRFGLLFSMFSITHLCCDNARYHWHGFGGTEPLAEDWMNRPLMLEMESEDCPADPRELAALLRASRSIRFIEKNSRPSELSQKAKTLIDRTYNTEASISAAARRLGVSHPHLTRQFKKDFGLTPIGYCHQLRAAEAMTRLMMGERIIDISLDVGYNDLGRFYKQFRKATNSSPGLCRSIMRGDGRNGSE
jgi:AraC-like DNA-binding protein